MSVRYAAPAFYQSVKYDLTESKVVAFQNYKIEVDTATNSEFTGELLNNKKPEPWRATSGTQPAVAPWGLLRCLSHM